MCQPAAPSSLRMRGVAAAIPISRSIMAAVANFIVVGGVSVGGSGGSSVACRLWRYANRGAMSRVSFETPGET